MRRYSVEELRGNDTVLSEIRLYDVDYRYTDAGSLAEQPYSAQRGYGYLDGARNAPYGELPVQTQRRDVGDNDVFYRFDGLNPFKQYALNLTFYHQFGAAQIERVGIDSSYLGPTFTIPISTAYGMTITVPPAAYANDGSMIVGITKTNALVGGFVNEIALEEVTLPSGLSSADLAVTGAASAGPLFAGVPFSYTLVVTNGGPDIATNVLLTATLPATVTLGAISATAGSCAAANPVTCALGPLNSGATARVTIVVTPTVVGPLTGFVSVTSDAADPNAGNSITVPVNALVVPVKRVYLPLLLR